MVYAGFWRRFCAYATDYVIVVIMLYVLVVPMGVVFGLSAGMAKDREQHSQHSALSVVEKIIPLAENSAVERRYASHCRSVRYTAHAAGDGSARSPHIGSTGSACPIVYAAES